jgi:hypothetical protein
MSLVSGGCFGVIGVNLLVVLMINVNESVKVVTETILGAGHFVLTLFSAPRTS